MSFKRKQGENNFNSGCNIPSSPRYNPLSNFRYLTMGYFGCVQTHARSGWGGPEVDLGVIQTGSGHPRRIGLGDLSQGLG